MFLYLLFIAPLELLMDLILKHSYVIFLSYGVAIIILSLIVNTILLPLYHLAEKWHTAERNIQDQMDGEVKFVKKNFKKQERMMLLNFVYRLHHYHPIMAVRTSFGFLIQVPFFFAAYHLLSHYSDLNGVSFGIFHDLAKPDGLLSIGSMQINIMPIIMTIINIASAYIYTKNLQRKEKIQLWVLSIIFLVLLYNSPVALVLYWTLNNIFSLGKNIGYDLVGKIKYKPKKKSVSLEYKFLHKISGNFIYSNLFMAVTISLFLLGTASSLFMISVWTTTTQYMSLYNSSIIIFSIFFFFGLVYSICDFTKRGWNIKFLVNIILVVLLIIHVYKVNFTVGNINAYRRDVLGIELFFDVINSIWIFRTFLFIFQKNSYHKYFKLFVVSSLTLASLLFWYLPFSMMNTDKTALNLTTNEIMTSTIPLASLIVFIALMVYNILPKKFLNVFSLSVFGLLITGLMYGFIFTGDNGLMTGFTFTSTTNLMSHTTVYKDIFLTSGFFFIAFVIARSKYVKTLQTIVALLFVVSLGAGYYYKSTITSFNKKVIATNAKNITSQGLMSSPSMGTTSFSQDKKNVVVFMTDGFTNEFVAQMMKEKYSYLKSYSGFTLYLNSMAVGATTYGGLYGLVGGLKYTPYIQNRDRQGNILVNFVNSYKRWLKLFKDNDYNTSLVKPQFLTYGNKNCYAYKKLIDNCIDDWSNSHADYNQYWDKINPNALKLLKNSKKTPPVTIGLLSVLKMAPYYMRPFIYHDGDYLVGKKNYAFIFHRLNYLASLPYMSDTNSPKATFKFIQLSTSHPPYSYNPKTCLPDNFYNQQAYPPNNNIVANRHYASGMCTIRYLATFIDWLKQKHIYDNTKIIIVSDHSFGDSSVEKKVYSVRSNRKFHSMMLVKDFNQKNVPIGINRTIFTTNADTPAISCEGLKNCEKTYGKNILKHPIKNRVIHFMEVDIDKYLPKYYLIKLHLKAINSVLDPKNVSVVKE